MAMSMLRDRGVPSGCEMDIPGLLTMILLDKISRKAAFLGNIVRADPKKNVIKISHCILPSRMHGYDAKPLPYVLRDFHGKKGVTAFTAVSPGTKVTLARAQRNLERIFALEGEVISSEDTTFCRNTLTVEIDNVRQFIRQAEGNHHALVIGQYKEALGELCNLLDCRYDSL
jgi:L-fucose isomerase-like protein